MSAGFQNGSGHERDAQDLGIGGAKILQHISGNVEKKRMSDIIYSVWETFVLVF